MRLEAPPWPGGRLRCVRPLAAVRRRGTPAARKAGCGAWGLAATCTPSTYMTPRRLYFAGEVWARRGWPRSPRCLPPPSQRNDDEWGALAARLQLQRVPLSGLEVWIHRALSFFRLKTPRPRLNIRSRCGNGSLRSHRSRAARDSLSPARQPRSTTPSRSHYRRRRRRLEMFEERWPLLPAQAGAAARDCRRSPAAARSAASTTPSRRPTARAATRRTRRRRGRRHPSSAGRGSAAPCASDSGVCWCQWRRAGRWLRPTVWTSWPCPAAAVLTPTTVLE